MPGKALPTAGGGQRRELRQIYLVQPPVGGGPTECSPPVGLLLLAAILERSGRQPHLVDLNLLAKSGQLDAARSLRTQLVRALPRDSSAIDLVGVSTWSYNFDITMEFVQEVRKRHRRVPIVLGGPHVTFVDRECLETFPEVDFVIRDEGDLTFPLLLEALEAGGDPAALEAIPGLTWRRGGEVVRNPTGPVVEDLDALPYPALHLVDVKQYLACLPVLTIEAGRGCPYNCNFCSTSNMFQRKYRVKSPARLVDEIEWTMRETGHKRFELLHDNLVANKKYVRGLCQEIRRRNIDVEWSCTSRPDNITEPVAEEMFLAGCEQVFFGVESLSAERQKWTGKGLKPPKVHAAVELTARQHIRPHTGIILGFPEETEEELDATVGAALRWTTEPSIRGEISTAVLRYYPGADLFQNAKDLRYDPLAAATASPLPGYVLRKAWRDKTSLFPLHAIHTPRVETRRNLIRVHFNRALITVCPLTFRACLEVLGLGPMALFDRMAAAPLTFLDHPHDKDLITNETVQALGRVVQESGSEPVRELLNWEVPFWETTPVVEALDQLEHVVHPKRFQQAELLEHGRGARKDPPGREARGVMILGVRAGREVFVSITKDYRAVLRSFRQRLAAMGLSG